MQLTYVAIVKMCIGVSRRGEGEGKIRKGGAKGKKAKSRKVEETVRTVKQIGPRK